MKREPERMCVVCRERFPKWELKRYVCPDTMKELDENGPVHDSENTMPGRGFYVCVKDRCQGIFPKMIVGLMKKRKGVSK